MKCTHSLQHIAPVILDSVNIQIPVFDKFLFEKAASLTVAQHVPNGSDGLRKTEPAR